MLAVALLGASSRGSAATAGSWLRERASMEWMVGVGGWRSTLGNDRSVPGFEALAGGGEVVVAFDLVGGLGLVASGRFLAGGLGDNVYLEGLGGLALQLRANDFVRIRAGAAAGEVRYRGDRPILIGGFLVASIDLFSLGGGRLAIALSARLDIDGHLRQGPTLPGQSLALAVGIGLRF